jgi:hypothetical protein
MRMHCRQAFAACSVFFASALQGGNAFALDEIYSPNAEYRELALEYSGSRTFDRQSALNNGQDHEFMLEAGVLPRLVLEVAAGLAKAPSSALRLEDVEVQGRYQFFEPGQMWVDTGLLVAYGFATQGHSPDALETKLLLEKQTGPFLHRANIGLEQEVGPDSKGGPEWVFLWSSRYRMNTHFEPGFEIQSGFGRFSDHLNFNEQEHYVGPAVYGHILPHLKYEAAYLFGASDGAADGAARVLLEYEMHF